jgi:hypothetical protein
MYKVKNMFIQLQSCAVEKWNIPGQQEVKLDLNKASHKDGGRMELAQYPLPRQALIFSIIS